MGYPKKHRGRRKMGSKKRNHKKSVFKSILFKMLARPGLVGQNPPGPFWGNPRLFLHGPNKSKTFYCFANFPW